MEFGGLVVCCLGWRSTFRLSGDRQNKHAKRELERLRFRFRRAQRGTTWRAAKDRYNPGANTKRSPEVQIECHLDGRACADEGRGTRAVEGQESGRRGPPRGVLSVLSRFFENRFVGRN